MLTTSEFIKPIDLIMILLLLVLSTQIVELICARVAFRKREGGRRKTTNGDIIDDSLLLVEQIDIAAPRQPIERNFYF